MLLINKIRDPQRRIAIGQIALVLGILLGRIVPRHLEGNVPDPWVGCLAGISAVLLGFSIVFNLTGLSGIRKEKDSRREKP